VICDFLASFASGGRRRRERAARIRGHAEGAAKAARDLERKARRDARPKASLDTHSNPARRGVFE
jgi:hypothetical protein